MPSLAVSTRWTSFTGEVQGAVGCARRPKAVRKSSTLVPGKTNNGGWHKSLSLTNAFTRAKTSSPVRWYQDGSRSSACSANEDGKPGKAHKDTQIQIEEGRIILYSAFKKEIQVENIISKSVQGTLSAYESKGMGNDILVFDCPSPICPIQGRNFWQGPRPIPDTGHIFHVVQKPFASEQWTHLCHQKPQGPLSHVRLICRMDFCWKGHGWDSNCTTSSGHCLRMLASQSD